LVGAIGPIPIGEDDIQHIPVPRRAFCFSHNFSF
jgi:hypothetical protein